MQFYTGWGATTRNLCGIFVAVLDGLGKNIWNWCGLFRAVKKGEPYHCRRISHANPSYPPPSKNVGIRKGMAFMPSIFHPPLVIHRPVNIVFEVHPLINTKPLFKIQALSTFRSPFVVRPPVNMYTNSHPPLNVDPPLKVHSGQTWTRPEVFTDEWTRISPADQLSPAIIFLPSHLLSSPSYSRPPSQY